MIRLHVSYCYHRGLNKVNSDKNNIEAMAAFGPQRRRTILSSLTFSHSKIEQCEKVAILGEAVFHDMRTKFTYEM